MKEHRIGAKFCAGLAVLAALSLGIAPAAQARDTGWDGTKIVKLDKSDKGNGPSHMRDTGWDGT